jgi:RNA polymerase sigma-70 factor (ECF subfamily)
MSETSFFGPSGRFPTTRWTMVSQAKDHLSQGHIEAVNLLIRYYWKPVFYFVRAKGHPVADAEDLTQEFFLQFLQKQWIRRVDRSRGRFRTFLLTILTRFLYDQLPPRIRRQQLFEKGLVPISGLLTEAERSFEPPTQETPDAVFLRMWAQDLVGRVKTDVRTECSACGQEDWYEIFEAAVIGDVERRVSQVALAERYGLTRDQVRYRIDQVAARFRRAFREELLADGCSQEELEEEQTRLIDLLIERS